MIISNTTFESKCPLSNLKKKNCIYKFFFHSSNSAAALSKSHSTDLRTFSQTTFSATPIRYNLSTFKFFTATDVSQLAASKAALHWLALIPGTNLLTWKYEEIWSQYNKIKIDKNNFTNISFSRAFRRRKNYTCAILFTSKWLVGLEAPDGGKTDCDLAVLRFW